MSGNSYNNAYILGLSFISALGGYLFGFDFAVISGALPFLRDQFGLNAYWEGLVTASLAVGAAVGCLVAGGFFHPFGCREGVVVAAAGFWGSSLVMAPSPRPHLFFPPPSLA